MSNLTPELRYRPRQRLTDWLREEFEFRKWILNFTSSMGKTSVCIFSRKVDFYERKHQRKADRRLVITPFLDPRAAGLPEKLGIEVYADPTRMPVD